MTKNNQTSSRINRIKQFLKPSLCEIILWAMETPFVSMPIWAITVEPKLETLGGAVYAMIPQAATYLGARAYELFGNKEHFLHYAVRAKLPLFK